VRSIRLDGVSARDGGQLGVEHTGEGEQGIALVLQRDAHRAEASCVPGLAGREFRDDEVEQLSPRRQGRAGQGQNVVAQPLHERSNVMSEPMCLGIALLGMLQLGGKLVFWISLTRAADPGLQHLAPRRGALGEVRQRVGQALALALDVEHVVIGTEGQASYVW
jgi:hypothetical protein